MYNKLERSDAWRISLEAEHLKRITNLDASYFFDVANMRFIVEVFEVNKGRKQLFVRKEFLTNNATTICIWLRKVLNDYQTWK